MSSFFSEYVLNASLSDVVHSFWMKAYLCLVETFEIIRERQSEHLTSFLLHPADYLHFNEFQFKLLKAFLCILLFNLFATFVAWKIYGKRICDRFMKPATSKAIEELRASVSRLKLPKEHTPRI